MLYLFIFMKGEIGGIIILKLVKIENQNNVYKETFENMNSNSRIKTVTYTYMGSEKDLNNFLSKVILDYAKENKIID